MTFVLFCCFSLEKDHTKRPNYQQLLEYEFLVAAEENSANVDMAGFITHVLDDLPELPDKKPDRKK